MEVEKILGRKVHESLLEDYVFSGQSILITGGNGSIGKRLAERLKNENTKIFITDVETLDVTNWESIMLWKESSITPDYIINCAGAKHAPIGEEETIETLNINTFGTYNLIKAFPKSKIILTSTCKSCNPETAYGATKLIAERLILNSGNSVARFYNVVETSGNIFEIWEQQEVKEVVEKCNRYFISLDEAVGLIIYAMVNEVGRYSVNPKKIRNILDIYNSIYKGTPKIIQPRRGDRVNELLCSTSETIENTHNEAVIKVISYHDKEN